MVAQTLAARLVANLPSQTSSWNQHPRPPIHELAAFEEYTDEEIEILRTYLRTVDDLAFR
jgi:hypothetical protein